jgi:hypothetical protein
MKILFTAILLLTSQLILAQKNFADQCLGTWKGTMYVYGKGILRDSVEVTLTVAPTSEKNVWIWRTDYVSKKYPPMTKDYKLKLPDPSKNLYITDEGGGLELNNYLFGNKLHNVFETQGITLTATYEMLPEGLIFEVTSGTKIPETKAGVTNFDVSSVQRVLLKKQ